jgi:predicted site-specific integrase-resolvase
MKLRTFAERVGVRYETAWRWFKAGKIKGQQLDSGTIIITEDLTQQPEREPVVVVYARVSANENRPNLDSQAERLGAYCAAKGWKVQKVVKEVGSGVNDSRKKLLALLADPTVTVIVVEHKDRLTRFVFKYIETLLAVQGRAIEVVNLAENPLEDLIADLVSIIYSFSSRLYGQRRAKRKTEQIVKELELQAQTEKGGETDAASGAACDWEG